MRRPLLLPSLLVLVTSRTIRSIPGPPLAKPARGVALLSSASSLPHPFSTLAGTSRRIFISRARFDSLPGHRRGPLTESYFYRHEVHRRFVSKSVLFAASPSPSALPPASSLDPPLKNAWGQRIIPLNDLSLPPSSAVLDLTDDLLRRGIPELADIKEGLVFFQLQQPPHPGRDSARVPDKAIVASPAPPLGQGDASSPGQAWLSLSLQSPGDGLAAPASEGRARLLGLPLRNGRLQDPQARPGAPRILLNLPPSSMDPSSPLIHPSSTITVTWNGDKIRTGSSHRCAATREDAVVPARKAALDAALTSLDIDLQALSQEDQVTGSGSSALRSYFSFVQPRPHKQHAPVDNALEAAALRAANQIAFLVRAYRAEQAEFLRNHDEAMSRLQSFPRSMHPLVLILDNVRSAYNVGSLFRTAETALLQELITCGFTPHPPHEKLKKTACRSLENVPSRHFSTTLDAVRTMKEEGFVVFAMETTSRSQCYTHVAFPEKAALVLGNEVIGVDTAVLEECDGGIIEIPTFGQKNSLNVASAAPVVVFEVLRQWGTFDKAEGKVDKT